MLEKDLQRAVADYLRYQQNLGNLWFTRLNSGSAFVKRGSKYHKIQLCDKGTADYEVIRRDIAWAYPTHVGVEVSQVTFLELKSDTGKQSKEQKDFQYVVEKLGCEYYIIRSIEELESVIGGNDGSN